MENSLSPAFVKIESTSRYAPHIMTIPSVPIIAAVGDAAPYFDLRGAEIDVSVETAVNDFVNLLKAVYQTDYHWNAYTVYTQAGVGSDPVPVWSNALTQAGTSATVLESKAIQRTLSFRATDATLYKLVLLDAPVILGYDRIVDLSGFPAYAAIKDYVVAPETWIASRGGGRPNIFLQMATTLNEKLRRSYRMN